MLRKHLGEKVKGVFYGSSTEVRDPISRITEKKSLKPFLVNQTVLMLERGQLRIPHLSVSEVLHRQMTNFQVVRISERTQEPVYSNEDEHGLDAMIFALYAFIEKYPELVNTIEQTRPETSFGMVRPVRENPLAAIEGKTGSLFSKQTATEWDEPGPRYRKVPLGFSKRGSGSSHNALGWGGKANAKSVWKKPF